MGAVRCKRSKVSFLLQSLLGRQWEEHDLFVPESQVHREAVTLLQQYRNAVKVRLPTCTTQCYSQQSSRKVLDRQGKELKLLKHTKNHVQKTTLPAWHSVGYRCNVENTVGSNWHT